MAAVNVDNRTGELQLPLPHPSNNADADCLRIVQALEIIDTWAASGGGVLYFPNRAAFPAVGQAKKLYVSLDTNLVLRWNEATDDYERLSATNTDDLTEGATNLFFTADRARSAQQPATAASLGVVRIGANLVVGPDGVLSAAGVTGGAGLPAFNDLILVPQSNGQKTFAVSGGYTPGVIELYKNGELLYGNGVHYTASDGSTFTLVTGAATADMLLLRRWTTATNLQFSALTGVPETLAGHGITDGVKKITAMANGVDLNTIVTSGFYRLESGMVNAPANYPGFGQMIVSRGADTLLQIVTGYEDQLIYFRQAKSVGQPGVLFTPWIPMGKKPVRFLNTTFGSMGAAALNAVNVITYSGQWAQELPPNPGVGDEVTLIVNNGRRDGILYRDNIAGSQRPIMGLNENMVLDDIYTAVTLVYLDPSRGWWIKQ